MTLALAACGARAQSVAFTIDDAPNMGDLPRLDAAQRNAAMLAALARHKVKAALFCHGRQRRHRPARQRAGARLGRSFTT
ncbi:hypothetical protein LP420_40130 [Massilia sp. B-10]|nr:hypothetical protein LP420_40130 [Massilia sp. B-10]